MPACCGDGRLQQRQQGDGHGERYSAQGLENCSEMLPAASRRTAVCRKRSVYAAKQNKADLKTAIRLWDETKRRLGNYLKTSDATM